jgi:hypothetical protein
LGTSFVATSQCCARLNFLASMGLAKPGCLGLSQHRAAFTLASLLLLTTTIAIALYGRRPGVLQTGALALLASACGLLLFVVP